MQALKDGFRIAYRILESSIKIHKMSDPSLNMNKDRNGNNPLRKIKKNIPRQTRKKKNRKV